MNKILDYIFIAIRWLYQYVRPRPSYYHKVVKNGLYNGFDRKEELIVSLTSFPARINAVSYTIESILEQTCRPNKVVLWLAIPQFPHKERDLPKRLKRLKKYGLEIRWTKNDIRSYKKLIPSLLAYPNSVIVTADDDVYYPPLWLDALYSAYLGNPNKIYCHRGNRVIFHNGFPDPYNSWGLHFIKGPKSGLNVLQTGVGGVLYPPHSLYKDVVCEEKFMNIAHDADDLWFWSMAVLQETEICVVKNNQNDFDPVFIVKNASLWGVNVHGNNDNVLSKLFNDYPKLKEIFQ